MHVIDFDLNLLKALDSLLETTNVTKAAARLGLSQPTMSHALSRLRHALADELLVRQGGGLVLTERAARLRDPVRMALRQAQLVLDGQADIDPSTLERTFTVSLADYTGLVLLPSLTGRLAAEAPGVSLSCRALTWNALDALKDGADLWLGVDPPPAQGVIAQKLFDDDLCGAVSRKHPFARSRRVALKAFAASRHLQIAPGGRPGGPLDEALAERGLSRRVVVQVPQFLLAPLLVAQTDFVLAAPRRLLRAAARTVPLHLFELPVSLPGFSMQQAWLASRHGDPEHRWFRGVLREVARAE